MPLTFEPETVPLAYDAYGTVRVGGTRVTLDIVISRFLQGASAEAIAERFDAITLADVYAALAYYLRHRAEVDAYLVEREAEADRVQAENDRRFPPAGLRERLLARRAERARR